MDGGRGGVTHHDTAGEAVADGSRGGGLLLLEYRGLVEARHHLDLLRILGVVLPAPRVALLAAPQG